MQSGEFLGICIGPLLKTGLLLKKKVLRSLAESVLVPLGLTTAALEANTGIHKKSQGWAHPLDVTQQTTSIMSNEEMDEIMKLPERGVIRAGD